LYAQEFRNQSTPVTLGGCISLISVTETAKTRNYNEDMLRFVTSLSVAVVGGVAQQLGRRSAAGGLSLIFA